MSNKKRIRKLILNSQDRLLEIKALVNVLEDVEQANYPTNSLLEIINKKIKVIFYNLEENRKIYKIID